MLLQIRNGIEPSSYLKAKDLSDHWLVRMEAPRYKYSEFLLKDNSRSKMTRGARTHRIAICEVTVRSHPR